MPEHSEGFRLRAYFFAPAVDIEMQQCDCGLVPWRQLSGSTDDTIARKEGVEYELKVRIMEIEDELKQTFDPLDATKTRPEDKFPLMVAGKMVLDRNPENYFAEVEQAAFCPASIVPGVELSADKLLQGRSFSYADTQRYRLGPNYHPASHQPAKSRRLQ
jgi:catalase